MAENSNKGVYITLDELMKLRSLSKGFNFLPKQAVQSLLSGQKTSKLRGRGLDFEELRHYLPGDDVRNIDWKVTARMRGEAHVRVYTEERDRPCLLVVDQRLSMFFGSKENMKSVTAAETAAIAAWRVLEAKDRVGALLFNDKEIREIRPSGSNKNVIHILKQLTLMNNSLNAQSEHAGNPAQLNAVLKKAASLAKHDYLVVIVSDMQGANEQTRQILTRISQHNDVILGFIHDPMEKELPDARNLAISDGELQLTLPNDRGGIAKQYQQQFDTRTEQARQLLLHRQVPLLSISTSSSALNQIRQALGRPIGLAASASSNADQNQSALGGST